MATRTIVIHDKCTAEGCNRTLHSISEGERGLCASCWVKGMKPEAKQALNKLIASAFNGSSEEQRGKCVDEAMKHLDEYKR